ncbi:hypothetical protein K8Z49_22040 [Actinomadura madurae]|uniref:hypothetical protein n=1 Tax=Actinomadura madurae TaxID=1993 RepID=UPI00399A2F31
MQCPTCGNDTPGTLGKCSHCAAPIDVYSVGPAVPLGAPVAEAPPAGGADALGDRTMMVPPPTPSWASSSAPDPAVPLGGASPQQTSPEPPAQPPLQLSVEPTGPTPAAASPLPAADPEDTAAWTFDPNDYDESGGFSTPPPPPAWANEQPASEPPPGGAPAGAFGVDEQPSGAQSIVPESWFAQPRKPEAPEAEATQVWGQQQPAGAPQTMLDADATQLAPAPMNPGMPGPGQGFGDPGFGDPGFGGGMDQTRMDPGSPMPMGAMGPGVQPMGPGGPGYGGFPPGQMQPGPLQPGQGKGGTSKPLVAAVAALVTVAVGAVAFVAWPSGGDDPSAGTNPSPAASQTQVAQKNAIPAETRQQAAVLNKILNDSVDTRRVLAGALGRAGKCKTLPQAIQGFQTVAQRRTNQLNRTKALKVDKLANGERLRTSLSQALTASLQVDQVLLRWAQANQPRCKGKPRPSAARVPGRAAIEQRATTAKKQFVVLWNPVAKKTGQPQRSWKRV